MRILVSNDNGYLTVDADTPCEWQWDRAYDLKGAILQKTGGPVPVRPQKTEDITQYAFKCGTDDMPCAATMNTVSMTKKSQTLNGNCGLLSWCYDGICADRGRGGFPVLWKDASPTTATQFVVYQTDGDNGFMPDGTVIDWKKGAQSNPSRLAYVPTDGYMLRGKSATHQDAHPYFMQASGTFS